MKFARAHAVEFVFAVAAIISIGVGTLTVWFFENRTEREISEVLKSTGIEWLDIEPDGTLIKLSGVAPNTTLWIQAMNAIQDIVPERRLVNHSSISSASVAHEPDFWLRWLSKGTDIFVFGVFPDADSKAQFKASIVKAFPNHALFDSSIAQDSAATSDWKDAVAFGIEAFQRVPNSNVSVSVNNVNVMARFSFGTDTKNLTEELEKIVPSGVNAIFDLSIANPLISPYTLMFELSENGAALTICHAETDAHRKRIVEAAVSAGAEPIPSCTLARGAPGADWAETIESGILAIHSLGGGTLVARDSLIEMKRDRSVPKEAFDRIAKSFSDGLGPDYSLVVHVPDHSFGDAELMAAGRSEFHASRHADGTGEISGAFPDKLSRDVALGFAQSMFETMDVRDQTVIDETSSRKLTNKILPGIAALSQLREGTLRITENRVEINGITAHNEIPPRINESLENQIGNAELVANISVEVAIGAEPLSPQECLRRAKDALAEGGIKFDSGSSEVSARSKETVARLADALKNCTHVNLEVAGFTDSRGRESMNRELSSARARAVLAVLLANGVLTKNFTSNGYGELQPIATNSTEEGREKNRRIEIRLQTMPDSQSPN